MIYELDSLIFSIVLLIILSLQIIFSLCLGFKKIFPSFCDEIVIVENNSTDGFSIANACISSNSNNNYGVLNFLFTKSFWVFVHFLLPFIIHMCFSTSIFKYWLYKYVKRKDSSTGKILYEKVKNKNWRYEIVPHIFSISLTITICAIWETIEICVCLMAVNYFGEVFGDSGGDMVMCYISSLFGAILISLGFPKPISLMWTERDRFGKLWRIISFVTVALSCLISMFDQITNDNSVVHIGHNIYILILLLLLIMMREEDRKIGIKSKIFTRRDIDIFWVFMFLFAVIMWGVTWGLMFYTYVEMVIGIIIYSILALFLMNASKM